MNRSLPFALTTVLFGLGLVLVWFIGRPGFLQTANQVTQPDNEIAPIA